MSDVVRGFQTKTTYNQKCTGCGIHIGPNSEVKGGYIVHDGEVVGLFHSRKCYLDTVQRFEEHKKKGGI